MTTHTFKLFEAIATHDGSVSELTIKAPKARTFVKHGEPFKLKPDGERLAFEFNDKSLMAFAAEMTGVDEILLGGLASSDYLRLRQEIANTILGIVPDKDPTEPSGA
jgi:hypothetical protein